MSATCGGCGREFDSLPDFGACEECQKEELNRQMNEQMWREAEEELWQSERDAGRL